MPVCGSGAVVASWSLLIRRHQRARCQAEIPLIALCKIPEPLLCFQIFLNTLAKKYSRSYILLFVDGAGNHNSGGLVIPSNITLSPLPPYSPELNPQENIWDEIREKVFKN